MKNLAFTTFALTAITACSNGTSPASIDDTIIFADDLGDTVQTALVAGETVTAKSALMNAVVLDRESGSASAASARSFALKLPSGDDEDVTIILDGQEVTFTASDRQIEDDDVIFYGWSQDSDNPRYSLWTWSHGGGAIEGSSVAGDSFVSIWEGFYDAEDDSEYKAYVAGGAETRDSVLTGLGNATYEGYANVKAYPDGSYDGFDTVDRLKSDIVMNADFGAGTISGAMTELRWGWTGDADDRVPVDGQITMETADIGSDGSYSGALVPNAAFNANGVVSSSGGTYTGDLFGPSAEATAGAIGMSLSSGGTDYLGTGHFNATVDD